MVPEVQDILGMSNVHNPSLTQSQRGLFYGCPTVLVQYILGTTMIFPSWLSMDVSIVQTILEKIIHYHLPGILCAIRGVLMFSGKASTFCTQIPFILRNRPSPPK
uniref:Uncharacterized protein n=1 Tax=Cacopsylla melanoneura TaxID=428564 RepID=A0A8D9BSY8_9HEMI